MTRDRKEKDFAYILGVVTKVNGWGSAYKVNHRPGWKQYRVIIKSNARSCVNKYKVFLIDGERLGQNVL